MKRISVFIAICLLALAGMFHSNLASQGIEKETNSQPPIEEVLNPNKKIQSLMKSLLSKDKKGYVPSKRVWNKKLSRLNKLVDGDHKRLVPELLYLLVTADDTREVMLPVAIIEEISLSKIDLLKGILPFIDSKNKRVRAEARDLLGAVEDNDENNKSPDFKTYEMFLREKKPDMPFSLVQYMYRNHPSESLNTLKRIYGDSLNDRQMKEINRLSKTVQIAIKEISRLRSNKRKMKSEKLEKKEVVDKKIESISKNVRKPLIKMASSKHWWVRLYAAEVLRQNTEFKLEKMIQKLKDDEHKLVRDTISSFKQE